MSWYDTFIAGVFPGYAVKRIQARQFVAAYEGAKTTRTHKPKREDRGPNVPPSESAVSLRQQARHLEQNNDIAKGAIDILVNRTVGMGIIPQFMVENSKGDLYDEVNEQLTELYDDWVKRPEVTWMFDETTAQRMAAKTFFRDGEVLIQHVMGTGRGINHGTQVPYSYELIEPDMLPMGKHGESPRIVSGVELNGWGRAVRYHMLKSDPNDNGRFSRFNEDTRAVSADRISHLANITRIRQVRGVSVFAVVLKRLQDIDEIDETERVAARMAAAMAVVIKKGDPTLYNAPENGTQRELGFEPGMILDDLLPGEEIQSIVSNRPNNALIPFKDSQLRHAAAGLGTGYSSLAKDYNGTYSSQRQELVEQHDHYGVVWKYLVERSERPKIENFIRMAQTAGIVKMPSDVKESSVSNIYFTRPALPWIQPLQEAKGWESLLLNGLESKSGIIRSRGGNPKDIQKAIKREELQNGTEQKV